MFRKLKKLKEDLQKKAEEATKEVLRERVGIERRGPEEPKRMVEVPATHPPTEIDEHLRKLVLDEIHSWRAGPEAFQKRIYHLRVDEEDRPVAVFTALEAMASRRFPDFLAGGGGFDEEAASYFESRLDSLSGEFMHEYRKAKAELLRQSMRQMVGIGAPKKGGIFPDLGRDAAPIDSPIGDWEGKFWRHKFVTSMIYKDADPNAVFPGENNIKISITQKPVPASGDVPHYKSTEGSGKGTETDGGEKKEETRRFVPPHEVSLDEWMKRIGGEPRREISREEWERQVAKVTERKPIDMERIRKEVADTKRRYPVPKAMPGYMYVGRVVVENSMMKCYDEEAINLPGKDTVVVMQSETIVEKGMMKRDLVIGDNFRPSHYEVQVETDFRMVQPLFFFTGQLKGQMTEEGMIRAEGTLDWGAMHPERLPIPFSFPPNIPESQKKEILQEMLKKAGPGGREAMEAQAKLYGGPSKAQVELTGRIHLQEDRMTNRITGTLCPKVPPQEITVAEQEGEALKIRMGEMDFTLYKTTP